MGEKELPPSQISTGRLEGVLQYLGHSWKKIPGNKKRLTRVEKLEAKVIRGFLGSESADFASRAQDLQNSGLNTSDQILNRAEEQVPKKESKSI